MSFKVKALILFLILSLILNLMFEPLVFVISSMPLHEMGHAICSWLGGRAAIPILMAGVTFISSERSLFFVVIFAAALIYLFRLCAQREMKVAAGVVVALMLVFIKFAFLIPTVQLHEYILLSGQIGEIILPAILVSLFFLNYLKLPYWHFWKLIFGAYGFMGFIAAVVKWVQIFYGRWPLPMGSVLSSDGAGASDGDLNQLLQMGWTEAGLLHFFTTMTMICAISIIVIGIYSFIKGEDDF